MALWIAAGWAAIISLIIRFLAAATRKDEEYEEVEQDPDWMALHTEQEQALMGRWVGIHQPDALCETVCVVHNPSQGMHRTLTPIWRTDLQILERICPHGIGHPDPDQTLYLAQSGQMAKVLHSCDGCCWSWASHSFGTLEEL